ncbi:ABC transporter ATP-binding protein [Cryobacterium sp. Y11]|uniref:ABC transporter ATP-binding protein n=1 Tax=Cryobacterium sp. Y11 TaxID=2045016 RepID=UPI000CE3E944|nr:ATP-binding cassette domain-containing protein [Cryobacterium sp. Y11]
MTSTTKGRPFTGKAMIGLEDLTKRCAGQAHTAVDTLTLEIPEGEIVVLVRPSRCGKTTTMKMINRIIEPTSGRITPDGEDVTSSNPDQLRWRSGYVIQQVGFFPYMTIGENVATVPKLLEWDNKRVAAQVDELLETVNMPSASFRDRYPDQLSGGRRQRVGVARALGIDPAVMLMDEPFGAIGAITRDRLQNEFLRAQEEVRKTIVFITDDIDEAVKLGDRIAILQADSQIAQYDTPERILTTSANDFVAEFIGKGAFLKRLNLSRVADTELTQWPAMQIGTGRAEMLETLRQSHRNALLVLDRAGYPRRWADAGDLQGAQDGVFDQVGIAPESVLESDATLNEALNELIAVRYSVAVVVDSDGVYQGVVDIDQINRSVRALRESAVAERRENTHCGILQSR